MAEMAQVGGNGTRWRKWRKPSNNTEMGKVASDPHRHESPKYEVVGPKEVADMLRIGVSSARELMRQGVIESYRPGGGKLLRTNKELVEAYIEREIRREREMIAQRQLEQAGDATGGQQNSRGAV